MMNLNLKFSSLSILMVLFMLSFTACKKDRIVQDDFQSMDSFYDQHKEEEQVFVIDSTGACPLISKKGTKICISADMLMYPNGTAITYPFTLKVVELYSIKDMILWRLPSIAGGNVLETSAEIRIRAFKGNDELVLKPGAGYFMEMDTMTVLNSNMQAYYGNNLGTTFDWTSSISAISPGFVDTISSITANSFFYALKVARMGWISSARPSTAAGANTNLSLLVSGTNTQNIEVYLSFAGFKGLMKISNLVSGNIPVGEQVKFVAFAKNQNNEFLLHQQTFTITAGQQISLNMQVVTEAALLTALEGM